MDSFVLSMKSCNFIKDLQIFEDLFDFSKFNINHEIFSNKNNKVIGKFKIETPKNVFIDEYI